MHIVRFAETIDGFVGDLMPHRLCDYLYDLCNIYTEYYDKCYCVEREAETKVGRDRWESGGGDKCAVRRADQSLFHLHRRSRRSTLIACC